MRVQPYAGCHERHFRLLDVIFSLPWAMKKRTWAEESIGFRMKCVFFASLRSQKELFGCICDYMPTYFITEQEKWLSVAKVVKRYGIHNVCTVIIYYDTWIWWLVSHIEIFGFLYWRCFVILDYDAFVRPYCNASSLQNLLILISRSFLATEDRRVDSHINLSIPGGYLSLMSAGYSTHVEKVRVLAERQ